jgi:hypothetical protein
MKNSKRIEIDKNTRERIVISVINGSSPITAAKLIGVD